MSDRLEFHYKPLKMFGLLLISIALSAGAWFTLRNPDDILDTIFGWSGIFFFGLCAIVALKRMLTGGTPFVFDRSGILFNTGNLGIVPWSEIASYDVLTTRGNQMLALTFKDPDRILGRLSGGKRKMAAVNRNLGRGDWSILFTGISPGIDEAVAFIREHVPPS